VTRTRTEQKCEFIWGHKVSDDPNAVWMGDGVGWGSDGDFVFADDPRSPPTPPRAAMAPPPTGDRPAAAATADIESPPLPKRARVSTPPPAAASLSSTTLPAPLCGSPPSRLTSLAQEAAATASPPCPAAQPAAVATPTPGAVGAPAGEAAVAAATTLDRPTASATATVEEQIVKAKENRAALNRQNELLRAALHKPDLDPALQADLLADKVSIRKQIDELTNEVGSLIEKRGAVAAGVENKVCVHSYRFLLLGLQLAFRSIMSLFDTCAPP